MSRFADRLHDAAAACGAPLVIGIDPLPDQIPALFGPPGLKAVSDFCEAMVARAAGACAALKPQLGFFEPFGADGFALAQRIAAQARDAGIPVILDAKRGDIGTTAQGYARAAFDPSPCFDADCVTINPYMGLDSLEPFLAAAQRLGKGVAVLVRTSNPGARDLQDLDCGGAPLWVRVAEMLAPVMKRLAGDADWSDLMIVAGATYPEEARRLRTILPKALFIAPGFGAQGASAADALAARVEGRGAFASASRSVLYPPGAKEATTLAEWRAAIDAAIANAHTALRAV